MIALQSYDPLHYGVLSSDDIFVFDIIPNRIYECNIKSGLEQQSPCKPVLQ